MELQSYRKKKKARRFAKQKGGKQKSSVVDDEVEIVTDMVQSLKAPGICIDGTQSQPQSRRGSSTKNVQATALLENALRRSSDVGGLKQFEDEEEKYESFNGRDVDVFITTRRGSVKRGSISLKLDEKDDDPNFKRIKSTFEASETIDGFSDLNEGFVR